MGSKKLKVLVATPVYAGKEYCVDTWVNAARTYGASEVLLFDNSESPEFFQRWRERVPMVRVITLGNIYFSRLTQAAESIRLYALANHYDYWLNLDADEMGPPELLSYLLNLLGSGDVLCHASFNRQLDLWVDGGFGCTLFKRSVLQSFSFADCPDTVGHDVWFFRHMASAHPEFEVVKTRGNKVLMHLDGEDDRVIPRKIDPELVKKLDYSLYQSLEMVQ